MQYNLVACFMLISLYILNSYPYLVTLHSPLPIDNYKFVSVFIFNYLLFISSVWSLIHVLLFATPWTAAHQASLSITNSQNLLRFMYIESVMTSNHHPLTCPSPPAVILCKHQGLFK